MADSVRKVEDIQTIMEKEGFDEILKNNIGLIGIACRAPSRQKAFDTARISTGNEKNAKACGWLWYLLRHYPNEEFTQNLLTQNENPCPCKTVL